MSGRLWVGVLFLLLGIGFFLHQIDIINLTYIFSNWWPFILIIIGLTILTNRSQSSIVSGFILILMGFLFLINDWFNLNVFAYIWPIIFITIGFIIILTRVKHGKTFHSSEDLNVFSLFSGAQMKSQSRNLQVGSVMAIFGSAEIDLREAIINTKATIDVTTIFGGVNIIVPDNVRVEVTGVPIFGGWEDYTRIQGNSHDNVLLKVNCMTIFGGAEIKN